MNRSSTLVAAGIIAAALLSAPRAEAGLVLQFTEAAAYAFDSSLGAALAVDDRGAWTAEAEVGVSYAQFDLASGLGQLYTANPPGGAVSGSQASVGFFFSLRNTGDAPVSFDAGAVAVDVDAVLQQLTGTGIEGVNTLAGGLFRLSGVLPGGGGQSLLSHNYFDTPLTPQVDQFGVSATPTGNATLELRLATPEALDYTMSFGAFTIAPGGRADFEFEFAGYVAAGQGSAGLVDALSTVQLRLLLPAGVDLSAERPLGFVTTADHTVPEPAGAGLLLAALLAWTVARRIKPPAPPAGAAA